MSSNEDNTAGEKPGEGEAVGFCRPPLATRFRPGRCGNPHGRPRRPRNLAAMVAEALSERVEVQIGERTPVEFCATTALTGGQIHEKGKLPVFPNITGENRE